MPGLDAPLTVGYVSERCRSLSVQLELMSQSLQRGLMLLFDYGYPRHEYYHRERGDGTLLCHFQQRAHGDPFFLPGLQDITASVDFTAVARARTGLSVNGYTTQAWFLMGCGLDTELARLLSSMKPSHQSAAGGQKTRPARRDGRAYTGYGVGQRIRSVAARHAIARPA